MRFAQKLKQLRATANKSQVELAAAAKIGLATIKDYEGGRRLPSLEIAQRLAAALGRDCRAFEGVSFAAAPARRPKKK